MNSLLEKAKQLSDLMDKELTLELDIQCMAICNQLTQSEFQEFLDYNKAKLALKDNKHNV